MLVCLDRCGTFVDEDDCFGAVDYGLDQMGRMGCAGGYCDGYVGDVGWGYSFCGHDREAVGCGGFTLDWEC